MTTRSFAITANAYKACRDAYQFIDLFKDSSKQIRCLSTDLKLYYNALGILYHALGDTEISVSLNYPTNIGDIHDTLTNSVHTFKRIKSLQFC